VPIFSSVGRLALFLVACLALVATARAESVYVVSQSSGKLVRFDSTDAGATTTVTTLVSNLEKPSALTFGPDGRLYIAEWGDDDTIDPRISRYDIGTGQWSVVATLDPLAQFNPSAIAFRPTGLGGEMLVGRVGIADTLGQGDIVSISGWNTGSPVVSQTAYNTGISLDGSSGLAVAADGTTYVSNSRLIQVDQFTVFAGSVERLSPTGVFQAQVIADGTGSGGLTGPAGLILDGGTLFTGSVGNSTVFQTNLGTLATTAFGTAGGQYEVGPLGMLGDGSILAGSLTGTSRIYRFLPNGSLASPAYFNADFGTVGGIAVAPVPEPGTWALAAAAAAAAWAARRRLRRDRLAS
jgi:hypothetical protein